MYIETGGDRFMVHSASGHGFQDEAVSRFTIGRMISSMTPFSAISQGMMGLGLGPYFSHGVLQGFGKPGIISIDEVEEG